MCHPDARFAEAVTGDDCRALSRAGPAALRLLIDDLGPWLAAEYTSVHGAKAPMPGA